MRGRALIIPILILFLALVACDMAANTGQATPAAATADTTIEEAVIKALSDYLEEQGAPVSQMNLEVMTIADGYARVEVISTDPEVPGGFNAFMKRENGLWKTVAAASGLEKEQAEAMGIPQSVWSESWLLQDSQPDIPAEPPNPLAETGCLTPAVQEQTQSLVDETRGFCLLYPASHTVEQLESGNIEIVLDSVMNHTDPRLSIVVEELAGRSVEQVVEDFLAGYEGFDIERTTLTVGGEEAIQLDRIPGQDYYRMVFLAHDGLLYQLSFAPYDQDLAGTYAQAENIFNIVIGSFRFISREHEIGSISDAGPPICPDLPRPAMLFQADNGDDYLLRHAASGSECTMVFEPPISRLVLLSDDGIYFLSPGIGDESTGQRLIHYDNSGMITELSFLDAENIATMVVSPSGSRIAWSQHASEKTAGGEEIVVSSLYSSRADGGDMRLLYSVDNAAEVQRGEPNISWSIRPLRFLDNGDLLFTILPDGRGGSWNAYTGRYDSLYQSSLSGGDVDLVYECPPEDSTSSCIGDISPDGAYYAVTERESSEMTLFRMDGTPVGTFTGPGLDYIGFPTFSPVGDLVFMTADVAEDQITIEQAFMSLVAKPYEAAAATILSEPLSYIWEWADDQYILYTAVVGDPAASFSPSLVNLDGVVERLPESYGLFQGVLP